jgi:hypothetical protein
MGNFYANYTIRGPSQDAVAAVLAGRHAIISPRRNGCVVAFDEDSDRQDPETIAQVASRLSAELACPVLAVVNHDDDIFWYQLYASGTLVDEYNSSPGYFDPSAAPSAPEGGNASRLAVTFGATASDFVQEVLRRSSYEEGGYTFAIDRHKDLVCALGLPEFAVGVSYESLVGGEYPDGLSPETLKRTT